MWSLFHKSLCWQASRKPAAEPPLLNLFRFVGLGLRVWGLGVARNPDKLATSTKAYTLTHTRDPSVNHGTVLKQYNLNHIRDPRIMLGIFLK